MYANKQVGLNNQCHKSAESWPQFEFDKEADNIQNLEYYGDSCQNQPRGQKTGAALKIAFVLFILYVLYKLTILAPWMRREAMMM